MNLLVNCIANTNKFGCSIGTKYSLLFSIHIKLKALAPIFGKSQQRSWIDLIILFCNINIAQNEIQGELHKELVTMGITSFRLFLLD